MPTELGIFYQKNQIKKFESFAEYDIDDDYADAIKEFILDLRLDEYGENTTMKYLKKYKVFEAYPAERLKHNIDEIIEYIKKSG
jgi:hypothetical protein